MRIALWSAVVVLGMSISCHQQPKENINSVQIVYDTVEVIIYKNADEVGEDPEFYIVSGDTIMAESMNQMAYNIYVYEARIQAEKEMQEVYEAKLKSLEYEVSQAKKHPDEYDITTIDYDLQIIKHLKESQELWLKVIESDSELKGAYFEGGTIRSEIVNSQAISDIMYRIKLLENLGIN